MVPQGKSHRRPAWPVLALLAAIVLPGWVWADEPAPPSKARATAPDKARKTDKRAEKPKVYGNDDLERMFGPSEPAPPVADPAQGQGEAPEEGEAAKPAKPGEEADPLAALLAQRERQAEQAREIADGEKKLADARERVSRLERRMLAIRNPLLARPSAPEGQEDWSAVDAGEQLRRTEEELAKAREEVDALERAIGERRGPS